MSTRKTQFTKFFSCNPQQDALFSINAGLELDDALQQASCFLEAAEDTMMALVMDAEGVEDPINRAWPAVYLVQMVRAIVIAATNEAVKARLHHG